MNQVYNHRGQKCQTSMYTIGSQMKIIVKNMVKNFNSLIKKFLINLFSIYFSDEILIQTLI